MEINLVDKVRGARSRLKDALSNLVFVKQVGTEKREIRFSRLKWLAVVALVIFIASELFLPNETNVQFSRKAEMPVKNQSEGGIQSTSGESAPRKSDASALWGAPKLSYPGGAESQVNHNTSMIVGSKGGNAKTQIRAGLHLPIRILDKFVVSQDQVPILAELIFDSATDSGLKLPAGTRFYGEASFQKGGERANVQFRQISLPNGQIRPVSGIAVGKDGQTGVRGRVFSDGMKNTAGQVLTTFVGGLAAGSMQTDIFGRSRGGVENGLLNAVSQTAQSRAQMYGEKLKTEREWIEVPAGAEADAVFNESLNLQSGGDYEQR